MNQEEISALEEIFLRKVSVRLQELERKQKVLEKALLQISPNIDKLVVENLHTDKVEFNISSIDVEELSGMLSIGLNYGGKMKKPQSDPPQVKKETQSNPQQVKKEAPVSKIKKNESNSKGPDIKIKFII